MKTLLQHENVHVRASNIQNPDTTEVHVERCRFDGMQGDIVIVKTPSFYTEGGDGEESLKQWMDSNYTKPCKAVGVLYMHNLAFSAGDSNLEVSKHLGAFRRTCRPNLIPSVIRVVPTSYHIAWLSRKRMETSVTQFRRQANDEGAQFCSTLPDGKPFDGKPETAWGVVQELLASCNNGNIGVPGNNSASSVGKTEAKDTAGTQVKEAISAPIGPTLKGMPMQPPGSRPAVENLADRLVEEFRGQRRNSSLDTLIMFGRTVLELTPPGHAQHHHALIHLADLLSERFEKEGTKEDLDEVITIRRAASEYMVSTDPQRQGILLKLDDCLYERFRKEGSMVDLEEIVSLRRAALEHTPLPNRCRSLLSLADSLHEKFQQQGLVADIDEAISLAHTASGLCRPGHPDHALSQGCLARCFKAKVRTGDVRARSKGAQIELSSSCSSDIRQFIKKSFFETVENLPPRLLHTPTGAMCNRDAQLSYFEDSPQYERLLSSASSLTRQQLQMEIGSVVADFFQIAMLSHRWGSREPLLREIEGKNIYDLRGTDGLVKLQEFCLHALERHIQWAWSDTCCIDKDSSAELQEAIGSMFSWYRRSSLTIVYLPDVFEAGSLADSVWFRRGWTLQELLASHAILFYTYDWSLYMKSDTANHKTDPSVLEELQKATGVAEQHLNYFYPGVDDARTRLHWASGRSTTRPEDIAYSLFGIFKVHLPVLYGESVENALGRLLAEIISRSGDISVLDWVGQASSFNSCFPASLLPYQAVPYIQLTPSNPAKHTDLDLERAQKLYSNLARLPRAGFFNRRLLLPCTIHPVTVVKLQGTSTSPSRYTYEIHASRLTLPKVTMSVNLDKGAGRYILVRPWDPKALATQTGGDHDAMWELLEQLKQPFNALLLEKLPHNEYRRIASDCMITACPQDLTSVLDSEVLIPEVV
ncbi:hypothetical protein F5J12DRAFT_773134 [Pisolithus orientalis]|uniref:uncharacterized protein n=1 Tax=Pisolithus orientalis TaxID=936130 RepID=UPI002224D04A|nr:uncharacterized protein F5J12DRAFT_773134 [Pisolithus orientalis]KAI5994926.1 hypothetical protein F5J12DRAFT_773134 [Pisolithus orientalis]